MLRIKVSGTKVDVRKGLGLVNFSFDVSDITKVEWKIAKTKFGQNEKVTVFISGGRKFSVETLMVNSDKMRKFIEGNVDETKINKSLK